MEDQSIFDIALYIGYFLVAVAVIAAVLMPLVKSFADPRSLLTIGAGIVGLGIIFLIGYALADSEMLPYYSRPDIDINSTGAKLIGGALITMYILIGLALISIAFTEISKLFR